jgi:hypothetical protein
MTIGHFFTWITLSGEESHISFISDSSVHCVKFVLTQVRSRYKKLTLLSESFGSKIQLPRTYFGGLFLIAQIIFISTNKG